LVTAEITTISHQQESHGVKRSAEGIQDQAYHFQRHNAEESLIARFPQNDRGVPVTRFQSNVAFRHLPLDFCPIGERERNGAFWGKANRLPDIDRQ
jgi:hypothetical protein